MKKIIFPAALIAIGLTCKGQSITPDVVASSGDHFEIAGIQLSWTIGEPISETFTTTDNTLTQGLYQSKVTIVSVQESVRDYQINVFPNPASDIINVMIISENENAIKLNLYDMSGKQIVSDEVGSKTVSKQLPVSELPNGVYFLEIVSENQSISKHKIIKNN